MGVTSNGVDQNIFSPNYLTRNIKKIHSTELYSQYVSKQKRAMIVLDMMMIIDLPGVARSLDVR